MKLRANGITINYEVTGKGPWITMSHSLACDLTMWDPQVAALAEHYTVLRYDTRGHGRSDAPAIDYTLDQLADDVKGLLDALGVTQTHWAGLSMGGMIGETLALRHPGVLRSLILADTTSRYAPEAAKTWEDRVQVAMTQGMEPLVQPTLGRWFTDPYRTAHPDRMAAIADVIRTTPPQGYAGCCRAISKIDVTEQLRKLKMPALILVGEQDVGTPPAMAKVIQDALAGSELVVIPQAAHISNIEQAERFTAETLRFLRALD